MASRRRGGRASAKRKASARAAAKRAADRRAEKKIDRRGSYLASGGSRGDRIRSRTATGGTSTGRESGIAAANTYDRNKKERSLEQSLGSIDRRVEKALEDGNTDLAKDLRSRQNKFAKLLGLERARKIGGGTIQGNIRTSDGNRPLTSKGFDVFQNTVDQDFRDSTRKLQNLYPDQFGKMYPITNVIDKGPLAFRGIRAALGDKKRKQIPYNLDDMPGVRYPLDVDFGAGEGEPFFGGRSNDPDFDSYPYIAPTEDVIMANIPGPDYDESFTDSIKSEVLPKQFDVIDPSTRSEVVDETMGDIIDSGVQDFDKLDKEFQKESAEYEKRKAEEPTFTDNYPYEVASNEPIKSYFNLFGQNDAPDDQILVDALNADMLDDGTFQSVTNPSMEEPQMQLSPIPVEDFLPEMNRQMEEDKFRLKADFPYLNDAQIEGLYNYKKGIGSKTPTSLDSNPVEFDDYMIKRMF